MRRTQALLVVAGTLGVGIALVGATGDRSTPAARVPGVPLEPPPATEIAAFSNLATQIPEATRPRPKPPIAITNAPIGIDLDRITREGDHYVARLADGRKARLTLDPGLQELAEKLLAEARAPRGAIVAMAPDGRILAIAGRRSEKEEGSIEGTYDAKLAIEPWAPSASVFKLVTASALIDSGHDVDEKVCFHGGIRSVMESNLRDSKRDARCETLGFGVAHSNNAILGKLAFRKLPPAKLDAAARAIGWGTTFPEELRGSFGTLTMPAERDLDYAKVAAGFQAGADERVAGARLSTVGGALVAATFADGGEQPVPQLIAAIDGIDLPAPPRRRVMSKATARKVSAMMEKTCDDGSAAKSFGRRRQSDPTTRAAGKTGTLTRKEPFHMEHSWFVGFAPVEQPKIIVSVVFGNAENWHLRGHEAARRLIDHATRREKDRKRAKPRS
jgi:cell division protein FtsI/penicillin-binding protein 2